MTSRGAGDFLRPQHPRKLRYPILALQNAYSYAASPTFDGLPDRQMMRRLAPDLRQVSNHEHLSAPAELCKAATYLDRGGSSYACINLVEHEGRHRIRVSKNHLQRQHHPR